MMTMIDIPILALALVAGLWHSSQATAACPPVSGKLDFWCFANV